MERVADISEWSIDAELSCVTGAVCCRIDQLGGLASDGSVQIACCLLSDITVTHPDAAAACLANSSDELHAVAERGGMFVSLGLGEYSDANFRMGIEIVRQLVPVSRQLGMVFSIRNGYGTSLEQLDELTVFFRDVGCPELRFELDAGAFQDAAVNPCDGVISFLARLTVVRLRSERRPIDERAILETLEESHFEGLLTVSSSMPD